MTRKTMEEHVEKDPAYFGYYAALVNQQNMLQDSVRTKAYYEAITLNPALFHDKLVLDVGAGSGILSYFAAKSGARVWAVEASDMAGKMQKIVDSANAGISNVWMKDRINVVRGKIETPNLPIPKVDTIISEPIGVLLVHERMLESFLHARDTFLKPGGALFPSHGTIYLAPFTDAGLWSETKAKVRFWEQQQFYGVDLSPLSSDAQKEIFAMPVVGTFDVRSLVGPESAGGFTIDFARITMDELKNFDIPIDWRATYTGIIHGIAGWFDLDFIPPAGTPEAIPSRMTTAPNAERTHWQQVRFLLEEPIAVNAGQHLTGLLRCVVNQHRSYTITAELMLGNSASIASGVEGTTAVFRTGKWDLQEQTYNYTMPSTISDQDYRPEYNCLYPSLSMEGLEDADAAGIESIGEGVTSCDWQNTL